MSDYCKLKIAIAGAGLMGKWHAVTCRRIGAQPIAVIDNNLASAAALAESMGGDVRVFQTLDDALAVSRPDVLHICTPLATHYELASSAIEAGVHVIVEKPLADTAEQTRALLNLADTRNVLLCPVHQFGFQRGVEYAQKRLCRIGELLHVRFTTASAGAEHSVTMHPDEVVADIIPHPVSVLQRLQPDLDIPVSSWQAIHSGEGELQLVADASDITLDIYISMNARPTRCEMELFGTEGRILLNFFHGYSILETGPVSRMQKMLQPFRFSINELTGAGLNLSRRILARETAYPGLGKLITACYQAIQYKGCPPIDAEQSIRVAQIRDHVIDKWLPSVRQQADSDG